jgi:hypothetical protein
MLVTHLQVSRQGPGKVGGADRTAAHQPGALHRDLWLTMTATDWPLLISLTISKILEHELRLGESLFVSR